MPRFAFDFGSPLTLPLRLTGIGPRVTSVRVENGILDVRFGLLRLQTPVANVARATVTGPYNPLRALGVHVSLTDLGLTFGTTHRQGLCIEFERPVSGVLPVPILAHPGLTVTVTEPARLQAALLAARDEAVAEQRRLVDDEFPHPPAGRGRARRDVATVGTALEVVRSAETAEPVRDLVDRAGTSVEVAPTPAPTSERRATAAEGPPPSAPVKKSAPARRTAPAKRTAVRTTSRTTGRTATGRTATGRTATGRTTTATPSDMPRKRPAKRSPETSAVPGVTKTTEQELAARRLAGNLPDGEGGQPTGIG